MPGDLRTRCFYSDVLYTRAPKAPVQLMEISNPWNNRERKFSFLFVSEKFMKSVKMMEEVVLVPTRLLDLEVGGDANIPDLILGGQNNLFEVFHLLKKFRDKMQTMVIMNEDEMSNCSSSLEVDDMVYTFPPNTAVTVPQKLMDFDSGHWSLASSASRESIEEDLVTSDDRSTTSSTGESEVCSMDSTTMVKQSLHSAKSLCTFLNEMTGVAHYIVSKYLQEMQCDLCE